MTAAKVCAKAGIPDPLMRGLVSPCRLGVSSDYCRRLASHDQRAVSPGCTLTRIVRRLSDQNRVPDLATELGWVRGEI